MTGDHSLCPLPLITSADSVDLGCRSRPDAFERIVTGFAEKLGHACFFANQFVAIEWKFAPRLTLPIFQRLYAIIEPCDRNTSVAPRANTYPSFRTGSNGGESQSSSGSGGCTS